MGFQIASVFPGGGKTTFVKSFPEVADSDSSRFDKEYFPKNYVCHIRGNMVKGKCTLVSSHDIVRQALEKNKIEYILVYPDLRGKDEFISRYRKRGSELKFIDLIERNWEEWVTDCMKQTGCIHVVLQPGQYLSDVISYDPNTKEFEVIQKQPDDCCPHHNRRVLEDTSDSKIIAVDFDGTCVKHAYPDIGEDIGAIPVLKALVAKGHQIILNTMRCGKSLDDAKQWFSHNDIPLSGVNCTHDQKRWTSSPKTYAHLYIDDYSAGAPLVTPTTPQDKPYIDWGAIHDILVDKGLL